MRLSTNLIRKFADINIDDKKIVELIQEHIGEVDYSHDLREDYKDIVIAEIVEKQDHPDADKLAVYKIEYGENDPIQVVAGDKTLEVGNKVAYLKIGAIVPYSILTEEEPFVIKKINLREVTSNGMMGSARELNLGNNHTRVMVLPGDAPVGEPFAEYYDLNDTVIDIENKALTNRGDLFGILGIARELAAILGQKFVSPTWYLNYDKKLKPEDTCLNIKVTNDAEVICPRYTALALDNIKVEESPVWLKSTLIKCGIKPVNNIVDITNYISVLIGQPLHAFDYDKLISNDPNTEDTANITVRMAQPEETILGLDDKLYTLDEETMVIADSTHPIAIAGVIGGKEAEVDENTKRVILESANFNKTSIRKTSMRLGIFTEAATRFKRNLDPKQCLPGLLKATEIIKNENWATIASEIVDIYHEEKDEITTTIFPEKLNTILGTELTTKEIATILGNLEYSVEVRDKKKETWIKATPPSWRKDIEIAEDIYEDIGRIFGFNNIPIKLPAKEIKPPNKNSIIEIKKAIREVLSNSGANESVNYSFVGMNSFKKCDLDNNLAYKIQNPLSPELSLMRTTLLQSLFIKARENLESGEEAFAMYEMNISHLNNYVAENKLPIENWYLSCLIANAKVNTTSSPYFVAKRYLEKIFRYLGIENIQYDLVAESEELDLPPFIKNILNIFEPNRASIISIGGIKVGIVGEINVSVKENHKLPEYSGAFEINLEDLVKIKPTSKKYRDRPVYPAFTKDLCFEMPIETTYKSLEDEIIQILEKGNLWYKIECLDIYSDEKLKERKRITYRITASDFNKTLDDTEIKTLISEISEKIEKENEKVNLI
ncbi:MAG: phenylalanine--tRNA ligase subunit beta [Candidatus Dojkabacteria bacterium]